MTKCNNSNNLKSTGHNVTAYNQAGENYFQQLAAYNSMSSHIRRILLAKSVIDAQNVQYINRKNRQNETSHAQHTVNCLTMDDMINKLAYDTKHHPMDFIRMNLNIRHPYQHYQDCQGKSNKNYADCKQSIFYGVSYPEKNNHIKCIGKCNSNIKRSVLVNNEPNQSRLSRQNKFCAESDACYKCIYKVDPSLTINIPSLNTSSEPETSSPSQGSSDRSATSTSSPVHNNYGYIKHEAPISSQNSAPGKQDDDKYTRFIFNITREIMQNSLYTDKELQDVFKKHIEENKDSLNLHRMLYEIYRLKISLNVMDEDDEDEELEDLIHTQRLLSMSEIRPPTPPKVLDENKVMEKLLSYRELSDSQQRASSIDTKSVVLVDANPQLVVTERDVLMSLMEVDLDPRQAQLICRSLFQKSKDVSFRQTAQTQVEASEETAGDINASNKPLNKSGRKINSIISNRILNKDEASQTNMQSNMENVDETIKNERRPHTSIKNKEMIKLQPETQMRYVQDLPCCRKCCNKNERMKSNKILKASHKPLKKSGSVQYNSHKREGNISQTTPNVLNTKVSKQSTKRTDSKAHHQEVTDKGPGSNLQPKKTKHSNKLADISRSIVSHTTNNAHTRQNKMYAKQKNNINSNAMSELKSQSQKFAKYERSDTKSNKSPNITVVTVKSLHIESTAKNTAEENEAAEKIDKGNLKTVEVNAASVTNNENPEHDKSEYQQLHEGEEYEDDYESDTNVSEMNDDAESYSEEIIASDFEVPNDDKSEEQNAETISLTGNTRD